MKKYLFAITFFFAAFAYQQAASAQGVVTYEPAADTITNTESDTIEYAFTNRNFDYVWSLEILSGISGTDSLNVTVQELVNANATQWVNAGSADVLGGTGSANRVSWQAGTLYGVQQRVIITGVGTQSTRYRLFGTFRRKS